MNGIIGQVLGGFSVGRIPIRWALSHMGELSVWNNSETHKAKISMHLTIIVDWGTENNAWNEWDGYEETKWSANGWQSNNLITSKTVLSQ